MSTPRNIPDKVRAKLAARLPGYDVDHMQLMTVHGTVAVEKADAAEIQLAVALNKAADDDDETYHAGPPLINTDGNPTILRVSAWMAHADIVNRNGAMFVHDELEALASTLWKAPNLGVMDWNHSALIPWEDSPEVIGVWYGAEFAFDDIADDGRGAFGLHVTGIQWAWLFPEQADSMIAEQERNGTVNFSMAAIPKTVEFRDDAIVLHDPVFLTNSALDRPPADADAVGRVTEDPNMSPEDLKEQLLTRAASAGPAQTSGFAQVGDLTYVPSVVTTAATTTTDFSINGDSTIWSSDEITWSIPAQTVVATTIEESTMDDDTRERLEAQLEEAEQKLADLTRNKATDELTEQLDVAEADVARLLEENEALATSLTEAETSKEALAGQIEEANVKIEELTAANVELSEAVAAFEAIQAETDLAELLDNRISELPDHFQEAHAKRDAESRERVEKKWANMDDETWEVYKTDELLAYATASVKSLEDRTDDEGGALAIGAKPGSQKAKLTALLKGNQ